jgi:putative ABC transport system substrate-binding protein
MLAGLVALSSVMISPTAAQTPRRMRMGWLSASTPSTLPGLALLLTYLSALGWRVGETLEVVDRQAEGDTSKLPRLAGEIVAARPHVIACTSIQEASALRAATTDIPIVFHFIPDPLALGIVTSLARPSGNITGIAVAAQLLEGKRLELLVDLLGPGARRFVWLGDRKNVSANSLWADAAAAAENLKVDVARIDVSSADGIEPAFDEIAKLRERRGRAIRFPACRTKAADHHTRDRAALADRLRLADLEGGLISYGPDLRENFRRGATYIDSILKGARPGDLPVWLLMAQRGPGLRRIVCNAALL